MCPSFPFGFEGEIWDKVVSIPDHCLSINFKSVNWYDKQTDSETNCLIT